MSPYPAGLFTGEAVAQAVGGRILRGDPERWLVGVSTDTRTLNPGELFIALRGERFDGHDFFSRALARGAGGVVGCRGSLTPPPQGWSTSTALIEVEDTLYALGEMARYWRAMHPVPLLAITGSNGKTTTKEMVFDILSQGQAVLKTEGNLNNRIGLPLTLLKLRAHHQAAVLEMGMNEPGEIQRLCEVAQPQYGLITQVASTHLEGLGSIEGVARAKGELFEALGMEDTAVVNLDDTWAVRLARTCAARQITFGQEKEAMIRALHLQPFHEKGARATLRIAERERLVRMRCFGLPYLQNALAAAASAWAMGAREDQIVEGLEAFRPFPMRLNLIPLAQGIHLIDDSYNANPSSLSAALETLCHLARGRTLAVLGDMLELGGQTAEFHQAMGKRAADLGVKVLIGVGTWAEDLVRGVRSSASRPQQIYTVASADEAIDVVLDECKPGDWILVKGSRAMALDRVVSALRERFSQENSSSRGNSEATQRKVQIEN